MISHPRGFRANGLSKSPVHWQLLEVLWREGLKPQFNVPEFVEVSPRDGLQNEKSILPTEQKIELVNRMVQAGARRIEVASFVNPARVPQMADAEGVVAGLRPSDNVTYIGLVLNKRGALRALETGLPELGAVCCASDNFGQRNQGQDADGTVEAAIDIIRLAQANGVSGQATIAVSFGCPFKGAVGHDRIVDIACKLAAANPREIALVDTIGVAAPREVEQLVSRVVRAVAPIPVRLHFHDTRGYRHRECVVRREGRAESSGRVGGRSWRMSVCARCCRQCQQRGCGIPVRARRHANRTRQDTTRGHGTLGPGIARERSS
jgi:hydroxymethylglutaryl-CoA lyase